MQNLTVSHYIYFAIFWGAIILLWWLFAGRKQKAMMADTRNPKKTWAKGVYSLVTGGDDYGFGDKYDLLLALSNSWEINKVEDFRRRFAELISTSNGSKTDLAWNLARAVNLARMAAGAKLISQEESWELINPVLPRIQQGFDGWEDLGQSYAVAYSNWISGGRINEKQMKDSMKPVETLKRNVWRDIPFSQPLN